MDCAQHSKNKTCKNQDDSERKRTNVTINVSPNQIFMTNSRFTAPFGFSRFSFQCPDSRISVFMLKDKRIMLTLIDFKFL